MATHHQNQLIGRSFGAIYPIYAIGGLYIAYPALAWYLFAQVFLGRLRNQSYALHPIITLWLIAMLAMLVVLVIGHIDWQLGTTATVKSAVGWAKGWALLAIFIFAGTLLTDRSVIVRAACSVGAWTVYLTPVLMVAAVIGAPDILYTSPLRVLGGSTTEFFSVALYEPDPGFGIARFRYFAPWAPAIGLMGNLLLLLCSLETEKRKRNLGMAGAVLMILLSLSRLGWIVAIAVPGLLFALARFRTLWLWAAGASFFAFFAAFGNDVIVLAIDGYEGLKSARSESTLVRQYLADIALTRWWDETPIWGHGRVESGPHLVQYMMIGSHHTWYGLLFVKGLLGAIALAVPLAATWIVLLPTATKCPDSRIAFGIVCVLVLYSFGENLEVLAYLYWPGLVFIGSVLQSRANRHA